MSNKENLVKNICNKLNITYQDSFFDNQTSLDNPNDTVSKEFLEAISDKCEISCTNHTTKGDLALKISEHFNANCEKGKGKDIGEADQIAKTYLEKINRKID